jgi:hypothetical protein
MKIMLSVVFAVLLAVSNAVADNYEVNVTRKGSNLYKVDGKSIFIES